VPDSALTAGDRTWLRLRRDSATGDAAATELAWRALWTSRALVWAAGVIALWAIGKTARATALDPTRMTEPFHGAVANVLVGPAARWDSWWYLAIAHNAYFSRGSSAFFPLYPLLIRAGANVGASPLLTGAVVSLTSLVGALYLLQRLTERDLGESVARTTGLLCAFFPTAFFLSAVYPESLYLLLSLGAVYAARLDRWAVAAALAALAGAARPNGVLIAVPLAIMYLYGPRARPPESASGPWWRPRYRVGTSALWLALVPLGLVAYLAYLGVAHGDALAPFGAQVFWDRHFAGPFGAVPAAIVAAAKGAYALAAGHTHALAVAEPLSADSHALLDFGFLAFAAGGVAACWRRVPFAYVAYAVAMLAQSLAYPNSHEPLMAFPRYVVVIFPLFMGIAARLDGRPRARLVTLAASGAGLAALSGYWAIWGWVA